MLVGTSSDCAVRLRECGAASVIAQLVFDGTNWWIRGRDTPDALHQDGVPSERFMLSPGLEIGLGTTTVIAESLLTVQLRRFCNGYSGGGLIG